MLADVKVFSWSFKSDNRCNTCGPR